MNTQSPASIKNPLTQVQNDTIQPPSTSQSLTPNQQPNNKQIFFLIAFGIITIIVIFLVILFLLASSSTKKKNQPTKRQNKIIANPTPTLSPFTPIKVEAKAVPEMFNYIRWQLIKAFQ